MAWFNLSIEVIISSSGKLIQICFDRVLGDIIGDSWLNEVFKASKLCLLEKQLVVLLREAKEQ